MSDAVKLPTWKQAAEDFLAEFKYGDMVTHAWMEQRFGMPSLNESQRLTPEQFRERQFEWLANVEAFKAALLKEHQVCLQSVRGEGYRWFRHMSRQTSPSESLSKARARYSRPPATSCATFVTLS